MTALPNGERSLIRAASDVVDINQAAGQRQDQVIEDKAGVHAGAQDRHVVLTREAVEGRGRVQALVPKARTSPPRWNHVDPCFYAVRDLVVSFPGERVGGRDDNIHAAPGLIPS